jgi:hypothetical protein
MQRQGDQDLRLWLAFWMRTAYNLAMNSIDAAIIRNVRRELGKRPFESTRVDVQSVNAKITLAGVATRLRDQPDINLKSEMDLLQKLIRRDRNVKEVTINVRLIEEQAVKDDNDPRGRHR